MQVDADAIAARQGWPVADTLAFLYEQGEFNWYMNSEAAGLVQGFTRSVWGTKRDVFTKASLLEDGIGVRVKTWL